MVTDLVETSAVRNGLLTVDVCPYTVMTITLCRNQQANAVERPAPFTQARRGLYAVHGRRLIMPYDLKQQIILKTERDSTFLTTWVQSPSGFMLLNQPNS